MAAQNSNLADYTVYYEDWSGGETVSIIDSVPPNDVTNLAASNVQAAGVTLSWTASTSADVASYEIYNGTAYLGTTANTIYDVTGLSPETSYTFTVKAINTSGNTSNGVTVTIKTARGTFALAMNGTSDYVIAPTFTFNQVIMDFSAEPKNGAYGVYLDASRGIAQSAFGRDSSGRDFLQPAWQSVSIDGVDKTNLVGTSAIVPANQRVTAQLTLKSPGKSLTTIFANQLGSIPMKGILYGVNFLLNGNVVASYDFTEQSSGSTVPDKSGNNNTATLHGGTWISR